MIIVGYFGCTDLEVKPPMYEKTNKFKVKYSIGILVS